LQLPLLWAALPLPPIKTRAHATAPDGPTAIGLQRRRAAHMIGKELLGIWKGSGDGPLGGDVGYRRRQ
jgi:hypothetical protein